MAEEAPRRKKWFPLEANPQVMNRYAKNLGLPTERYAFYDVISTEEWALQMIPGPVLGVVLLYPLNDNSNAAAAERLANNPPVSPAVYHMTQYVGNACGTIGILHLLANCQHSDVLGAELPFEPESFLERFFRESQPMSSEQRGRLLEESEALSEVVEKAHQEAAHEGQSRVPDINEKISLHFVALIAKDGCIDELDGRHPAPINHGPYQDASTFGAEAVARVVKQEFIDKDPTRFNFNIVALVPEN